MSQEYVASGYVKGGQLKVRDQQAFYAALSTWKDCEVLVRIEQARITRSLQANRYYWGVVVQAIAEHTGYTPEETHEVLKQLFLPKSCAMCDGNGEIVGELVIGGSTAALSRDEFMHYCERVREFAAEKLGLRIASPEPEPVEALR